MNGHRETLLKLAARCGTLAAGVSRMMKRADEYSVAKGDTLSGIASRNGTTWQNLARLNGLKKPDAISIGQKIRLPAKQQPAVQKPVAAQPARPVAQQPVAPVQTPASRMADVSAHLHKRLNNPNLEAALLANFNRETGGSFNYAQKEIGSGRGYGIPQYTGPSLKAYKSWLTSTGTADSAKSQLDYFVDKYMPSRAGYKAHMAPGAQYTREQYADWLHRRVFTPAHTIQGNKAYSPAKISKVTSAHNAFMNRLKSVNGVWQGV